MQFRAIPVFLLLAACSGPVEQPVPPAPREATMTKPTTSEPSTRPAKIETATFGAGCFWCVEAVLQQVDGVVAVRSGYMGGTTKRPTYEQVCSGATGHAEVVQVDFDPARIGYDTLLDWFWRLHDPTTLNRQGNDVGTQYRSAIFFHSPEQRAVAEKSKAAAQQSFSSPIVTEITPASDYFAGEAYHQDYYRQNRTQGYCRVVIRPKLEKLGLQK